ncbi:hypothetical protein ISN45_Aa07g029300, partial [Arabidopsis thaliana x Arabidopsis arenosa]
IISRVFKPSVCKNFLRHTNVRRFSSATPHTSGLHSDDETKVTRPFSSKPAYPFLLIDYILNGPDSSSDGRVTTYNGKEVFINDKKLMEEVCDAMTVGFSRDGLRFHISPYNDKPVISYEPSNPKLEDMTVHLPSLPTGSKIQNLAMSSLPVRDKDWVVGVKLSGYGLSLCRPFGNSKWININTMSQCINPLSSLMFSKTDQRFYIPSLGGNFLCYLDLNSKEDDEPKYIDLEFDNLPKSVIHELADVSSCSRTDHLVESPTGQLFLVKWYGEDLDDITSLMRVTKRFMVYRENEESDDLEKTMIYTEDIGDLCIFVGHSEAFCVPASSSRGLKPNCIYFVGDNFGVYDLTTITCTTFYYTGDEVPLRKLDFPYWPPPIPLY